MARAHVSDRRRRLSRVLISSTDVSVVNRTTLSLWHFQQLAQTLLPCPSSDAAAAAATTADGERDDNNDDSNESDHTQDSSSAATELVDASASKATRLSHTRRKRGITLGEGMSVAAFALETDESDTSESESSDDSENEEVERTPSDAPGRASHDVLTTARLTPATDVAVVYKGYRCVVCFDASPSTLSIDPATGRLFLDMLYESVELFIWGLLCPMRVGDATFAPEIHLSVIVQGAHVESLSVLVQGYVVTASNAAQLLRLIKERIELIEDDWASRAQAHSSTINSEDDSSDASLPHTTRASLAWLLQNAVFALNSLPSSAAPLLVLVTDGVVDLFDAYSYDNLLMQLVRHDVQCHFLRVGGGYGNAPNASFGFVPDVDLLGFIAGTTGGTVLDYVALHAACYDPTPQFENSDSVAHMTSFQHACFVRASSVHAISAPVLKLDELCCTSFDGRTLLPLRPYRMWREKVHEYRIFADVERIIEARVREGFRINKVHIKTYERAAVAVSTDADNAVVVAPSAPRIVTKILLVFLLQWKQNVWLEYVVSATTESAASTTTMTRRPSAPGLDTSFSLAKKAPHEVFAEEQSYVGKWSEWYVKVNILAYADFLRAFEDSAQVGSGNTNNSTMHADSGSPLFLHEYIRNVQDVDRVLLHLMTATAAAIAPVDATNQYSFGTGGSSVSAVAAAHNRQQTAHPVFNIIGELSPVLWHRWFYVERFELLAVVKSEACSDVFYRQEDRDMLERVRSVRKSHMASSSRGFLQLHRSGNPMYRTPIGMERVTDRLMAVLQKWSSQRLSKDLFLRFLQPTAKDKQQLLRAKAAGSTPSAATTAAGGKRQQQRPAANMSSGIGGPQDEPASIDGGSKASLCFVRLEIKNKTLCAIHVAFFSTTAAARKQTLNDLKANIIAGVNDTPPSPLAPSDHSVMPTKSVVLSQRLISRLVVAHETLLLHDGFDGSMAHDHEWTDMGNAHTLNSCCGGSELQLRSVFGSYMWHSSWRWHISSPEALLNAMRRLHEARVESGFWVLDWRMESDEDTQSPQLESIIFGREILMEDENGNTKTSLVQYALRRVSETCLMTSIWMEPQHGVVKTQLASHVDQQDRFHWGLRHAVGHDVPFDDTAAVTAASRPETPLPSTSTAARTAVEHEQQTMAKEDVSVDWPAATYLGENDLLQLIRGFIFKSDRHFLSCLYTFDCILHYRESLEQSAPQQLDKDAVDIVGATWSRDRLFAANLKQLLPPFSTVRLLRNAKRRTEHFLMFLDNGVEQRAVESEALAPAGGAQASLALPPKVSLANEHLYSMLERTLRGLSDCEVAWTDCNGGAISGSTTNRSAWDDSDRLIQDGMSGQMPLWLKDQIASTFPDHGAQHALSKGKCFAKLVGDDTVVLAFLPSLETLQLRQKAAPERRRLRAATASMPASATQTWLQSEPKRFLGSPTSTATTPPLKPASKPSANSQILRMSVSADDIVLYQERRLSFREGYKSWRMGHYHGARDDKQSSDDFRNLHAVSMSEDQAFCEEISRETEYGCDSHVLIERESGTLGSGFFQVAFYECSITRLSTDRVDSLQRDAASVRADLPQMILNRLFVTSPFAHATESPAVKARDEPLVTPGSKDERRLSLLSPSSGIPSPVTPSPATLAALPPVLSATSLASRRFQKKVKRAHEHNFSRGVYIALREGGDVQQSDLLQALTSCMEIPVDLDITLLYRMMQASSPRRGFPSLMRGSQRRVLKEKLDKAVERILASAFVSIPGTKYFYFTGSEVAAYEDDLGEIESELHVLMDDSDEVSSTPVPDDDGRVSIDDSALATTTTAAMIARTASESSAPKVFSPHSKPPLPKASPRASGAETIKAGRRFKDQSRPPPVETSPSEVPLLEPHTSVEEDAEFNKEVAVATSIFSAPFFFRFECREISTPRASKSRNDNASPVRDVIQRSASTQSFGAMHRDWVARTDARKSATDGVAFPSSKDSGVVHVAETFDKAPSSRIALRLITLTLPNEQLVDSARRSTANPNRMLFELDDSTHGSSAYGSSSTSAATASSSSRAHVISTLPLFQRQALQRVRKDMREWCSVEVLDILRVANRLTPAISQLVQRLFADLPAHSLTTATYPLDFVATSQDALANPIELFKKELERGSAALRVRYLDGVYFVVESPKMPKTMSADAVLIDDTLLNTNIEIPYWAFFTVESDTVKLQLQHPDRFASSSSSASTVQSFDRLGVLTRLHLGVMAACKRVNQFLLLLQLHETRSCNDVLLPPSHAQVSSPHSPHRHDSGSNLVGLGATREQFFWPGQFECDLQYSAFFRLHERLSPTIALNMLCTSALEQFQVHNRRHVFVYRDRGGHVFYMKISVKHEPPPSSDVALDPSRRRVTRGSSGLAGVNAAPSSSTSSSTLSMTAATAGVVGILLEVFGVCVAGEEVTQELCRVLERKLDEATQLILMKLLARNAKFQLSASDMAFVCPPGGKPAHIVELVLPSKLHDATSLLQFLSQTLSAAPFVRNMNPTNSTSSSSSTAETGILRASRRHSLHGAHVAKLEPSDAAASSAPQAPPQHDPAFVHPSLFFVVDAAASNALVVHESATSDVVSPVFMASQQLLMPPAIVAPKVVDHASFVLNLNPELRLSPGFLSRIGKGLAVFHIEHIQHHTVAAATESDEHVVVVKSLAHFDDANEAQRHKSMAAPPFGTHDVVRCQLWIRGSINASELAALFESNLREAMLDYQIEATLKALAASTNARVQQQQPQQQSAARALPPAVQYLTSVFEQSWRLSSASVTKLALAAPIAPWDMPHVVHQLQTFLRCVPTHLRPAIYSKRTASDEFTLHDHSDDDNAETNSATINAQRSGQFFRLVARLESSAHESLHDAEHAPAASHHYSNHSARGLQVYHSDSVQSDMSDMDSVSNKLAHTWTSMTGSESNASGFGHANVPLSSSSSSTTAAAMPVVPLVKEFSESELLLYPNVNHHHHHQHHHHAPSSTTSIASSSEVAVTGSIESEAASLLATSTSSSSRSFYYVIDISCTDGLQAFGYNMSSAVVDTILVQFARILTWSKLRETLVRSLLFEKSGLARAAPLGLTVVHPRDLYANGSGSAVGKSSLVLPKDFCVNFVELWQPAMVILTGHATLPRLLDAALLRVIEGSSLGKYLREAHTLASDRSDAHRPRAPSNASLHGGSVGGGGNSNSINVQPELHRDVSSQSSSRSLRSEPNGAPTGMTGVKRGSSSTLLKIDRTVASPTKRGITGGGGGSSATGSAFKPGNGGTAAIAVNPRMRPSAGAANALLAARARARGALPGRLGGPGTSSKASNAGDAVAPWDLPLTNTKGPVLTGIGAVDPLAATAKTIAGANAQTAKPQSTTPPAPPSATATDSEPRRGSSLKAPGSVSGRDVSPPPAVASSPVSGFSGSVGTRQTSLTPSGGGTTSSVSSAWRKQLEVAWGPRFEYHDSAVHSAVAVADTKSERSSSGAGVAATPPALRTSEQARQLRVNPLAHFSDAFHKRWLTYEARSTTHTICMNLFDKLVHMPAGDEMDEPVALSILNRVLRSGHQVLLQRFRVTFVERWENVKVDDEYVDDDMQDGRLRALQASMDLVNLLSYKKTFVFAGNECNIATFYTEHTVVGMCAQEGDAVRDMKKQIMRNIFHLRMGVAHDFYDEYAVHLRELGFRRLRTLTQDSALAGVPPTASAAVGAAASSTLSSSLSSANMFGADSDGFTEYFYFPGKAQGKLKGWQPSVTGATTQQQPATLLLLELKCDHHGVQLGAVLVNERDLVQHDMGFQCRLAPVKAPLGGTGNSHANVVSGELVACISTWLRDALRTRAIIYGFTIRFFQQYLTKWSNDQHERERDAPSAANNNADVDAADDEPAAVRASSFLSMSSLHAAGHDAQSFQNIVKGVRCFLHAYPEPPLAAAATMSDRTQRSSRATVQQPRNSVLRTAVVELPPTQLHSNCSESILVKILLRYIACHGARYEVLDLMQFGTPDAVVCHSPSGSFFHRHPTRQGPQPFGYRPPREHFSGYSLLITTLSLVDGFGLQAHDKKRRKHCIQLILLKSATPTAALGVGNGVLPVDRALLEAEYFVQELFRVAAQHYERDLLWSRLLYDDSTGPGAIVAATLALPATHFTVDVGPQQLEECLRLSVCTPLDALDPTLAELVAVDDVCWQEFALRLRDVYADQLREYQFVGEDACHFLLLCPNTHDLIIHLTFLEQRSDPLLNFTSVSNASVRDNSGDDARSTTSSTDLDVHQGKNNGRVQIEICRREEPPNRTFTFAQRRVITDFVNSIVHWQWRSLLYD